MEEKEIYLDGKKIKVTIFISPSEIEKNVLDLEDTIDLTETIKKVSKKKKKVSDKNGNK